MRITKAVITVAGESQRTLQLQGLVDRDGEPKPLLRILLEEVIGAGVETVCLVVRPGDEAPYAAAAQPHSGRLHFVTQAEPRGYGHAIYCARDFVGQEPFLHLVGDHLYLSGVEESCARQLVAVAEAEECSVSAVQATRESMLPYYGTVGGPRVPNRPRLYTIREVIEKPTPTEAEQRLVVPGLRAGHYLCFFGMHVFTPTVMELLQARVAAARPDENIQLSPALAALALRERYLAYETQGRRYDVGVKYGFLNAQIALALEGRDRDEVLAQLVELLALRSR
ncbi:MAG: sugar phosphate nucleotidyltransferase [Armatimonadota bacterium]|nr:sugar phosphate nucleotidyltransferase [Armatimonadota bacterium]